MYSINTYKLNNYICSKGFINCFVSPHAASLNRSINFQNANILLDLAPAIAFHCLLGGTRANVFWEDIFFILYVRVRVLSEVGVQEQKVIFAERLCGKISIFIIWFSWYCLNFHLLLRSLIYSECLFLTKF